MKDSEEDIHVSETEGSSIVVDIMIVIDCTNTELEATSLELIVQGNKKSYKF